jgi:hypothetical protein
MFRLYRLDNMSIHFFESELNLPANIIVLPIRSTVIKTAKGVIVISPINFTEPQLRQIEALGPVTDLVAPSLLHHLYITKAGERFKSATIWGPEGCKEKLPEIKWGKLFGHNAWTHSDDIEFIVLKGMPKTNEIVFFEKSTLSLIVTDLLFNLTAPKGWAGPILLRILGTYKKFGISRLTMSLVKDRDAFINSAKNILNWNFDQIVMAHGNVVSTDGKNKFIKAFEEKGFVLRA